MSAAPPEPSSTPTGAPVSPATRTPATGEASVPPVAAPPRRALRLSTILSELKEIARVIPPAEGAPSGEGAAPAESPSRAAALTSSKSGRKPRPPRTNITFGEILDRTAHAGFGFLSAFMAIIAVPLPGIANLFGLAIAFGALQMIAGFDRPWLPKRLRAYSVSMRMIDWLGVRLARWTRGLEKLIRPRFEFMSRGPFWTLCGVGLLIQSLGLSLPLPIPYSNTFFVIPIVLYAVALLESDGLLIMLCHTITAVEVVAAIAFSDMIVNAVVHAFDWLRGYLF
ncbi:MAG: hypothetical protein CHACPFDD_01337 [Phycisphaerae bacterium]|nr:hypothetical protein [Phycisphaerae bacterium]